MSGSLKPYPEYKDSGVSWLGEVPAHWELLPHLALFQEVNERNHPDEPLLSVTIARGVIPQEVLLANGSKKDSSNLDKSNYKLVQPGDITYNKMRAWQGALGVSKYRGIVSPAYIVVRPRKQQVPKYYHYLLRTPAFITEAERWSYGITSDMWSLRSEDFKRIYSVLPPYDEQHAIARFLDHYDRLTRRYIRTQRRLIDLLEEQKQTLVQQAVTRGLDPDVPLKDSGIEWMGKIPAHWEVSIVKRHFRVELGKMLNRRAEKDGNVMRPYLNAANVHWEGIHLDTVNEMAFAPSQLERYRLKPDDLLVTEGGVTVGRSTIWNNELSECYYQNSLNRARSIFSLSTRFLYYWMYFVTEFGFIDVIADKATFGHLTNEKLNRLPLVVPPSAEADSIVCYLDESLPELSAMEQHIQERIALIREYCTRLIADVVTGKLDVRGVPLPDLDETGEPDDVDDLEKDLLDPEEGSDE